MLREGTSHRRGAGNDPGLAGPGAVARMRLHNPRGEAPKAANMAAGSERGALDDNRKPHH